MNTIKAKWDEFTAEVLSPTDNTDGAYLLFKAGAAALFDMLNMLADDDSVSEDAYSAILDGIEEELGGFIGKIHSMKGVQ